MTNSREVWVKFSWKTDYEIPETDTFGDTFELEDKIKFAPFVRRDNDQVYYGLQLMDLNGMNSVTVFLRIKASGATYSFGPRNSKRTFVGVGDKHENSTSIDSWNRSDRTIEYSLECLGIHPYPEQLSSTILPLRQMAWKTYEEEIETDVGIVTIESAEKEFKVPSLILVSQSDVFKRMLCSDFKEAKTKVIPIKEVAAEVMEVFIRYLYLGTVGDDGPIEELFKLGSKYMISDLKNRCADLMTKDMSPENAVQRLILSYIHQEEPLKKYIQTFIEKGGLHDSVYMSNTWRKFVESQA